MSTISVLESKDLRSSEERFWSKVDKTGDCWLWTASVCGRGYGQFFVRKGRGENGKVRPFNSLAHRAAWEFTRGKIPERMTIDHLCKNILCVNPDHLEVVTMEENIRRGEHWNSRKSSCPKGHTYDRIDSWVDSAGVTNYARRCDRCRKQKERERHRRR